MLHYGILLVNFLPSPAPASLFVDYFKGQSTKPVFNKINENKYFPDTPLHMIVSLKVIIN